MRSRPAAVAPLFQFKDPALWRFDTPLDVLAIPQLLRGLSLEKSLLEHDSRLRP